MTLEHVVHTIIQARQTFILDHAVSHTAGPLRDTVAKGVRSSVLDLHHVIATPVADLSSNWPSKSGLLVLVPKTFIQNLKALEVDRIRKSLNQDST